MKTLCEKTTSWMLVSILCLATLECGSSNRLREYEFKDRTAAAIMAFPPRAEVVSESFVGIDEDDLIGSVIRIGTTIAKEVEIQKAQMRLEQAMERVDVPERIRTRTLEQCSQYLHYRPIDETKEADFMFDMNIRRYGIEAKSWSASVNFRLDVEVQLLDNKRGVRVWKARVKERQPVTRAAFGYGEVAGDVITAVALSELSEEELVRGFEHLADYAADRITKKLKDDFIKARSNP